MSKKIIYGRNGNKTVIITKGPRRRGPRFHTHQDFLGNRVKYYFAHNNYGQYVCTYCGRA